MDDPLATAQARAGSFQRPGQGPLTFGLVVGHATGMLRLGFDRVAVVALVLFIPPAILTAFAQPIVEEQEVLVPGGGVVLALVLAGILRLIGPVVYAGYLDEAVGAEYFGGKRHRMATVVRSLPWGPLLVADLVVVIGTAVGLSLLVVPGIVFYLFVGLVGPVIVQERRGVIDGFRRTIRISRTALVAVGLLVVIPIVIEEVIHEAAHQAVHDGGPALRLLVEWLVAAVVGGTVGLLEVGLATELMARNPEPRPGAAVDRFVELRLSGPSPGWLRPHRQSRTIEARNVMLAPRCNAG